MNATHARSRKSLISFGAAALLALGAAGAQVAMAASATGIDNTGNFQSEVNACLSGNTQQAKSVCLREARNAKAEKQRGRLSNMGDLQANALARCDVFKASDDRAACQERVTGPATVTGSIAGGGVLRQAETTVTSPAATTLGGPAAY